MGVVNWHLGSIAIFQIGSLLEEIGEIEISRWHAARIEIALPAQRLSPLATTSIHKQYSFPAFSHIRAEGLCYVYITSPTSY